MSYPRSSFRPKPKLTAGKFLGGCFAVIGIAALVFTIEAWGLMLLLGILHLEVAAAVPALGFWQTFWVILALNAVGAIWRGIFSGSGSK